MTTPRLALVCPPFTLPEPGALDGLDAAALVAVAERAAALHAGAMARLTTMVSRASASNDREVAERAHRATAQERGLPRNDQLRILRPAAAAKKLGVSKMTLYRWEESGAIPPRIKLSAHAVGWQETTLDDFLRNRPAARETSPCPMPTRRTRQ